MPGVPARRLIDLGRAMASCVTNPGTGKTLVLSVVEVPEERSLSEGVSLAQKRREVLRRLGGGADSLPDVEFAVRAAHGFEDGVRDAVRESNAQTLLIGWRGPMRSEERLRTTALDSLILAPPCDLSVFKPERNRQGVDSSRKKAGGEEWPPRSILVPVRGGLHAQLSLDIAQRIARHFDASLTVMRIERPDTNESNGSPPITPGLPNLHYDRTEVVEVTSELVEEAIVEESGRHQMLILGASARGPRATHLFGYLPERVADRVSCNVMVVKTAEPLSLEMFGMASQDLHTVSTAKKASISQVVDRWFAENTFHSHEFEDLNRLMRLKERNKTTISVALPALNEAATVGKIITTIKQRLMDDVPLLDEMVLIDSNSEDRTREIAEENGVPVFIHSEILPRQGSYIGKGEALWKSLYVTKGDIVVWIDSDVTDIHPKFVYGLVGPLLTQPRVDFVKGYYRRPLNLGTEMLTTGGGRVTELTARPLINLFYPELSGLVQPLAGEMAGRRSLLERLPFFTGYGVETGLLIDILERHGLRHIGQTDLENRVHRNQDMISLSKMAFAIVQVVMRRLEHRKHIPLLEDINTTMKLIHYSPDELFLEVKEIQEHERPPMVRIAEYRSARTETGEVLELEPAT